MDRIRLVTKIKREDAFVKNVKEEAEYVADDEQTYYTVAVNTVSRDRHSHSPDCFAGLVSVR